MRQRERLGRITAHLAKNEWLSVEEAVSLFAASPATVRRDFATLAGEGRAERERGGVRAMPSNSGTMSPFSFREGSYSIEKDLIAAQAVSLLRPGDVIIVDGGTTTFHMARHLPAFTLRLITNSTALAAYADERHASASLEIFLTGGFLHPKSHLLTGPGAVTGLRDYHADWAFLSAGGVCADGVYNNNERAVELERVMAANSDRVVILADHSKIGKQAMCRVCGLERIHTLITDFVPETSGRLREIEGSGVKVVAVKDGNMPKA